MYLRHKLNQNAHIALQALKYWQQLNLSVKNLVKELKTFDLQNDLIIQTITNIYSVLYIYILWTFIILPQHVVFFFSAFL